MAQALREMAALLEAQSANPYRVAAYRHAADTVAGLAEDVAEVFRRDGIAGLDALPGVGPRIAAAIAEMLTSGGWRQLEQARGDADPVALPRTVPGPEPAVGELLDVDADYRRAAQAGELPMIAPRRFNPEGRAWLPVLHTERGDWHFTALFSNTARAHELGRVRDWVVLYADHPVHGERQYTVVTAQRGALAGRRVVRGREAESRAAVKPGGPVEAVGRGACGYISSDDRQP